MSLLELKEVTVSFAFPDGRPALLALNQVNLSVAQRNWWLCGPLRLWENHCFECPGRAGCPHQRPSPSGLGEPVRAFFRR